MRDRERTRLRGHQRQALLVHVLRGADSVTSQGAHLRGVRTVRVELSDLTLDGLTSRTTSATEVHSPTPIIRCGRGGHDHPVPHLQLTGVRLQLHEAVSHDVGVATVLVRDGHLAVVVDEP